MTSGCLDRKEVRGPIWGVHSTTDRPAGGNTGRLFLAFGGPVCADRISNCPLDRVLTYKNLIYLLNLQVCAGCRDKKKGSDPCIKYNVCTHCDILTEEQKLRLATPAYKKKRRSKN